MLLGALYLAIYLSWTASLALLLSVSTDAPLGAVGGAVLVSILSQILDQITALDTLRDYLPTHYATAWSALLATEVDWGNMTRGVSPRSATRRCSGAGCLAVRPEGHHELRAARDGGCPHRRRPSAACRSQPAAT